MGFIICVLLFHLLDYWLFYEYQKTKKIDMQNITSFESMMFWPFLLLEIGIKK